ncbi:hypothetical protein [Gilliamella sp. Imp1-1]|uniref:hypothetical protein n=1 Tax=Gilliamella sp. Imp1-1 TaxID=3120248 RepID=UPI0004610DF5|nr:hypothetical protein [Gilliamella apicola]KDN09738.1 hypothetical protein GAPWKB30_1639 [Gilliamella apicola]
MTGEIKCIIILGTRHWQTYALNLSNNFIRRVFARNSFIFSKLSLNSSSKLFRKILLVLGLLLLPYLWSLEALASTSGRANNYRSDAIILPSEPLPDEPFIPAISYVRPNKDWGTDQYAGPIDAWNVKEGFPIQSDPKSNFPTTGADGLFFDLAIKGVDPDQLTWTPVTHDGITVTVKKTMTNDRWTKEMVTRVTLKGPEARFQWYNPYPRRITVPRLPWEFVLVGRDRSGNEIVRYAFVLQKWFVHRGDQGAYSFEQDDWCRGLGYRIPQVKDLTNAVCFGLNSDRRCNGAVGATPSSTGNHYQRRIGAGFFAEWGLLAGYRDTNFNRFGEYWTGDDSFVVNGNGSVMGLFPSFSSYGICTTP